MKENIRAYFHACIKDAQDQIDEQLDKKAGIAFSNEIKKFPEISLHNKKQVVRYVTSCGNMFLLGNYVAKKQK